MPTTKHHRRKVSKSHAAAVTVSRRRLWMCRLAALAFPLFVLAAAELTLRALHFAPRPPLFVPFEPAEGPDAFQTNPDYAQPFFFRTHNGRRVPHGEPVEQRVSIPKPPNVFRVVFIGGSTVEGFPHAHNLTASRFLEAMLNDVVDGRTVEVVNLGFSALASFPLTRLARDSLAADPDLAIVYSGHNEFYGAYGVASLQTAFTTRRGMLLHAAMRRMQIVTAVRRWTHRDTTTLPASREDLIDIMSAATLDGPDDPRFAQAEANLRGNLIDIFSSYRRASIPVLACTLVCNEADVAPFASVPPATRLTEGKATRWTQAYETGTRLRRGDPETARQYLRTASELFADHAGLRFAFGQVLLRLGDAEAAQSHLAAAIDLDVMPWRAGAWADRAIRAAATRIKVPIAEVEEGFHRHTEGGPIGWELMSDHLHPSVEGQALFARILVQTIAEGSLCPGLSFHPLDRLRSLDAYRKALGDDPLVELATTLRMAELFTSSPLSRENGAAAFTLRRRARRLFGELDPAVAALVAPYMRWAPGSTPRLPHPAALSVAHDLRSGGREALAAHYYRVASLTADPYSYERLEALAGWYTTRHSLGETTPPEETESALREGGVILARSRRAGADFLMAQLSALAGRRDDAIEYMGRNWRGLTDRARREMIETVLGLLPGGDDPAAVTADQAVVFTQLRESAGGDDSAR